MIFTNFNVEVTDLTATKNIKNYKKIRLELTNQTGLLDIGKFFQRVHFYMGLSTKELHRRVGETIDGIGTLHCRITYMDGEPDEPVLELNPDAIALMYVYSIRTVDSYIIQQDAYDIASRNMDRSNNKLLEELEKQEPSEH